MVCRIPEARDVQSNPPQMRVGMIGSKGAPSAPSSPSQVDLGVARIPKDGEPLRHLKPVSPSFSRRLPDLLRA